MAISLFSIIIIIIIIIVTNIVGIVIDYHRQLQLKHDMIVLIASITILKVVSSLYSCVYRCWINGSRWIYKGPVLAILLVSTNDFIPITFTQPLPKFEGQELNKSSDVSLRGYKFTEICMKG